MTYALRYSILLIAQIPNNGTLLLSEYTKPTSMRIRLKLKFRKKKILQANK